MAVAISSITTATENGASATISLNTSESPTATNVGDLVIVVHGNDFYALSNMGTPTATGSPTMNSIVNADGGTNEGHLKCWWYVANTGGAQNVSVTETGTHDEEKSLAVYVLTGADTVSPIDGTASNFSTTGVASQVCKSISPANSDSYCIQALTSGTGAATTNYTAPGGVTEKYDIRVSTLMSAGGGIDQLSASGATGDFTWTAADPVPYASATFAIKTAAAASSTAASGVQSLPMPLLLQIVAQRQAPASNVPGDVSASAEVTTSTGTAFDATVAIGPSAEATTSTGTAFDATEAITATAQAATATGTASDATASTTATAEAATATGSALDATDAITVNAEATSSTGTAFDATVSTVPSVNANAEVASGTGAASDASVALSPAADVAAATGTAFDATTAITTPADVATATGTAFNAVVSFVLAISADGRIITVTTDARYASGDSAGRSTSAANNDRIIFTDADGRIVSTLEGGRL